MGVGRLQTVQRPNPFIYLPFTARPSSATSGLPYPRGAMWSITGDQPRGRLPPESDRGRVPGTLQCDAYVAYGSFVKNHARKITLAGCWAHTRGKFYEAREQAPQRCGWILRRSLISTRIEENLRRSQAGPRKRAALRLSQSRPIYLRLHRALVLFKKSGCYLPRSAFGQAIDYALSNWPLLCVYLENGRLEIDNNLVENAIRPTAVGKKNWLFLGDADAGHRSAILCTIIESCRVPGIDPYAYLRDVLTRLPSMTNWQVKQVTPEA